MAHRMNMPAPRQRKYRYLLSGGGELHDLANLSESCNSDDARGKRRFRNLAEARKLEHLVKGFCGHCLPGISRWEDFG